MMVRMLLLVCAFALSACASTQRTLSYHGGMSDADVMVGNQRFQVWFHERDATVLVMRGAPRPFSQLLAQNLTVFAQDQTLGIVWWGAAANAVLNQMRCSATEVTGADQMREVSYVCDAGVDVRAAVDARREVWRQGVVVAAPAS